MMRDLKDCGLLTNDKIFESRLGRIYDYIAVVVRAFFQE